MRTVGLPLRFSAGSTATVPFLKCGSKVQPSRPLAKSPFVRRFAPFSGVAWPNAGRLRTVISRAAASHESEVRREELMVHYLKWTWFGQASRPLLPHEQPLIQLLVPIDRFLPREIARHRALHQRAPLLGARKKP